jgi:uncharacterized membrane protein
MNPAIARRRHQKAALREREREIGASQRPNVGQAERWASLVGGGVLTAYGLLRGSACGLALAAIGGALAYRGYTGHCHLYDALDYSTADEPQYLPAE